MKTAATTFALGLIAMTSAVQAENLTFTVFNDSSADLVEFNLSAATSDSWEANLMRGGYLAPGYEIDVVVADGSTACIYDLRGVFSDGSTVEDYDIDVCSMSSYTFTD